jgi:hypothetical protein
MQLAIAALGLCLACVGEASERIVEFRQGDRLPVSLSTKGDFLETVEAGNAYVNVKRNFWLKLKDNDVQVSLDGVTYKPIKDVVAGTFSAGTSADESGGVAGALNVALEAYLK